MYALITGASSGIGRELAFRLSDEGYDLILVARRKTRLNEIKEALHDKSIDIRILDHDLSDLANCQTMMDDIKDLDVKLFINNAGFGQLGSFDKTDLTKELAMIDLNIKSLHYLTKRYIELYKSGIIVNISSMAAFLPTPLMASYAATKAYVYSFSQAVNYEMKKANREILVLTVAPGPVRTEFAEVANANPKMKGISVAKCAKAIVKGIKKHKRLIVPGIQMKFVKFFLRFLPLGLVMKGSYKIQNKK